MNGVSVTMKKLLILVALLFCLSFTFALDLGAKVSQSDLDKLQATDISSNVLFYQQNLGKASQSYFETSIDRNNLKITYLISGVTKSFVKNEYSLIKKKKTIFYNLNIYEKCLAKLSQSDCINRINNFVIDSLVSQKKFEENLFKQFQTKTPVENKFPLSEVLVGITPESKKIETPVDIIKN